MTSVNVKGWRIRMTLGIHETSVWPRVRCSERSGSKDPQLRALMSFALTLEAVMPRCRLAFEKG